MRPTIKSQEEHDNIVNILKGENLTTDGNKSWKYAQIDDQNTKNSPKYLLLYILTFYFYLACLNYNVGLFSFMLK